MNNLIEKMRETLGTAFDLYTVTHTMHWNVEGNRFYELHKLFEDQYNEIWKSLDDIAEHLRALDAYTPHSLIRLSELSLLTSPPVSPLSADDMLIYLVEANEIMIDVLNETLVAANEENQQGIINFIAGRIEADQKNRWQLRASAKNV